MPTIKSKKTKSFIQEWYETFNIKKSSTTNSLTNKNLNKKVNSKVRNVTYNIFDDKLLLNETIQTGLPYSLFNSIQLFAPFSESDWANFLDVSTKTLNRYKLDSNHNFKTLQSERIIEIAEVTKLGLEVFGEMNKFKLWLDTPCFALGKLKPVELLKSSYGKELLIGELTRIDQGIFI